MANPFVKGWRYLMALFDSKIEDHADPKIQVQQAIAEAQQQHRALTSQAAAVIGNQRQLEMQLNRQLAGIEKLEANTRQALEMAEQQYQAGNPDKAREYENAAEVFAAQLVTSERSVQDLKALHDQALHAAQQAKTAVENNAHMLQGKLAERSKLLNQIDQTKMQEQVNGALNNMSELTSSPDSPSLDKVRDKIEQRYAKALGGVELHENSIENRLMEVERSGLRMEGHSRLEAIRASMSSPQLPPTGIKGEITSEPKGHLLNEE